MDKVVRIVDPSSTSFVRRVKPIVADDCKQHIAAANSV
jgi:hypothetical protein